MKFCFINFENQSWLLKSGGKENKAGGTVQSVNVRLLVLPEDQGLGSQHSHGSSQPSVTPAPETLIPLLDSMCIRRVSAHIYTHAGRTLLYINRISR